MKILKTWRFVAVVCSVGFITRSLAQDLDELNTGNTTSPKPNTTEKSTAPTAVKTTVASNTLPDIVITDKDKQVCLLATFNLVLSVDYTATDADTNETYIDSADIDLPLAGSKASGNCSTNESVLSVSWSDPTVSIHLKFSLKKNVTDYWAVTSLSLQYDTSNATVFPNAQSPGLQKLEDTNVTLFATPVNESYTCAVGLDVDLDGEENGATVSFTDLQLQAFGTKGKKFAAGLVCPADFEASKIEKVEVIVPLVVAGCLTVIVLVVIIGYIVSRQTNLSMSGYRSME